MPYDIADSVPIAWDVKDSAGALVTASSAVLTITLPDGTTATPAIPTPSPAGQYRVTYVPTVKGRYTWRAVTTAPNTAYQDVFEVRETSSPALLSLADARTQLKITSTTSDDELRGYLDSATDIVESYVGPIVTRSYTRRINMRYRRYIHLPHTNVTAITGLTLVSDGSTPIALTDLSVDPGPGIVSFKTPGGIFPYNDMDITYTVGRSYVKANWILAASMIVQHLWQTKLGNLPSVQGDDAGYVVTGAGHMVPYRAIALLQPDSVGDFG
jgi:hypothetical protein